MSEDNVSPAAASDEVTAEVAVPAVSPGALLKTARDAAGMHMATLSMVLKVPIKKLEALEADDWAVLPDPVFVRALATSVCRQIKTDSAPILAALPAAKTTRVIDGQANRGLNQSFRAPSDPKPSLLKLPISMPMMLAATALLMAALVIIFLPDFSKKNVNKPAEVFEPVISPTVVAAASVVPAVIASSPAPVAAPALPALPVVAPVVSPQTTASKGLPTAPLAAVAPAPVKPTSAPVAPVIPAAPVLGNPTLKMVAKGVVWIEVKDAKGVLLMQRTLQPKEVVNITGPGPLAVVVGRINEMSSVEVRGKPFSLAGLSPDNVARFAVK
jgi:cytoskeleton protein RodZ